MVPGEKNRPLGIGSIVEEDRLKMDCLCADDGCSCRQTSVSTIDELVRVRVQHRRGEEVDRLRQMNAEGLEQWIDCMPMEMKEGSLSAS